MARDVSKIHRLEGTLVVNGELSIGSGLEGADADIEAVRDGLGRLIIPGESLAGVLLRAPGVTRWDGLLGRENASPIWVEDSVVLGSAQTEVRDHGNRDRHTGAAADKGVFSREVVPHGTQFAFKAEVEEHGQGDATQAATLAAAVAFALKSGVSVGARQSAGAGCIRWAEKPKITSFAVSTPPGHLAALLEPGDVLKAAVKEALRIPGPVPLATFVQAHRLPAPSATGDLLQITIQFSANSPILASVATEGVARMIPALERRSDGWYGRVQFRQGLRTIAERIERTLRAVELQSATAASVHASELERQLLDPRCVLTRVIFGSQGGRMTGTRGAWRQAPALTKGHVASNKQWQAVLAKQRATPSSSGTPADRMRAKRLATIAVRDALKLTKMRLQEHIQLEAWSGAPLEGHLFGLVAITRGTEWAPCEITVDLAQLAVVHEAVERNGKVRWSSRLSQDQLYAAIALILFTLREAAGGELGLGHGTSRALGEISIDPAHVTFETASTGPARFLHGRTLAEVLEDAQGLKPVQDVWTRYASGGDVTR